jgi:phospholipase/carboxylesterase
MTLPTVEHETAAAPTHAVLWLHGLGADGHDFAPIVPELVKPGWPPLRFVFPHAPMLAVTINGGMSMRAWYDIKGMDLADKQDVEGTAASVREIEALIAREVARGIPASRIVLAGFSQGGAVALAAGVRHGEALAGIVALSTYLPLAESVPAERSEANAKTPIFWGHGRADPVVPMPLGRLSQEALLALGYAIEWHDYPMGHQVCAEEIDDLARWLGGRW